MAHPDDVEILAAGTIILFQQKGWEIHLATMSAGDLGSQTLSREETVKVRRGEAEKSAAILGASYHCLGFEDLSISCNTLTKRKVCALIRKVQPDAIFTHSLVDYMMDHEETPKVVREAAFLSSIPNFSVAEGDPEFPLCKKLPVLYYSDAIENIDALGRRLPARQIVDITDVMPKKERMLSCHASQREWLRAQHGEDEYVQSMKRWNAERAKEFDRESVRYAEGFHQHLGHAFPKDDILTQVLGSDRVRTWVGGIEIPSLV